MKKDKITFIIPCRNNLPYLKQAVDSICEYYGDFHNIIILDDASTDGTWDWVSSIGKPNIKTYRNDSNDRVGHTVLYDIGIMMADTEIVSILHSDMIISPNYVENMLKHLYKGVVVSATRIEPPLHPPGPEKFVVNFGLDVDEFTNNKSSFLEYVHNKQLENENQITNGIFAPWAIYKSDFVEIGGHDLLFAPMELEDSDIFNRFYLKKYKLVQSRDAFVYHMTCRGSRFKDGIEIEREIPLSDGTVWYKPKDSDEYTKLRQNKFREWWRKWHTNVLHDTNMLPIVPTRYNTSFVITNCNGNLLGVLEPWCDNIYVDCDFEKYVSTEDCNSMFSISDKVHHIGSTVNGDIVISFDGSKLTNELYSQFIENIPFIVTDTNMVGEFEWNIFKITIKNLASVDMVHPFFVNVF